MVYILHLRKKTEGEIEKDVLDDGDSEEDELDNRVS